MYQILCNFFRRRGLCFYIESALRYVYPWDVQDDPSSEPLSSSLAQGGQLQERLREVFGHGDRCKKSQISQFVFAPKVALQVRGCASRALGSDLHVAVDRGMVIPPCPLLVHFGKSA